MRINAVGMDLQNVNFSLGRKRGNDTPTTSVKPTDKVTISAAALSALLIAANPATADTKNMFPLENNPENKLEMYQTRYGTGLYNIEEANNSNNIYDINKLLVNKPNGIGNVEEPIGSTPPPYGYESLRNVKIFWKDSILVGNYTYPIIFCTNDKRNHDPRVISVYFIDPQIKSPNPNTYPPHLDAIMAFDNNTESFDDDEIVLKISYQNEWNEKGINAKSTLSLKDYPALRKTFNFAATLALEGKPVSYKKCDGQEGTYNMSDHSTLLTYNPVTGQAKETKHEYIFSTRGQK